MSKHDELILAAEALLDEERRMFPEGTRHLFYREFDGIRRALTAAKAAPRWDGYCWLAEVVGQRKDGPYYIKDEAGGTFGWYTNDPLRARRWYVEAECAAWCESANKRLTSKVVARAHGFGLPHPTPAAPDRGEMERVARETLRLLLADLSDRRDGFDIASFDSDVQDEIRVAHEAIINRAVAAATRGV